MASRNSPSEEHEDKKAEESSHNGETEVKANDILHDTITEFKQHGDDLRVLLSEYIREKPLKSLGIALVTGMAIALFLKR
jgi:ElaB/YqjD/DUF883 family membrane-anchored ribosome-binding protein